MAAGFSLSYQSKPEQVGRGDICYDSLRNPTHHFRSTLLATQCGKKQYHRVNTQLLGGCNRGDPLKDVVWALELWGDRDGVSWASAESISPLS